MINQQTPHRVGVSNQIHTGSNHFTEKTTILPEEWKPNPDWLLTLYTLTRTHAHTHTVLVIKFSRIPRSARDSLLWAVQGCQDHHNDIKAGFYWTITSVFPPHSQLPSLPHLTSKCSSVFLVHFKSGAQSTEPHRDISVAARSIHKPTVIRGGKREDVALSVCWGGFGRRWGDILVCWNVIFFFFFPANITKVVLCDI